MYICSDCENIFSEDELDYVTENMGECWGYTAYRRIRCCPLCRGEIESLDGAEGG